MLYSSLLFAIAAPKKEVSLTATKGLYEYNEDICIRSWKTLYLKKCQNAKFVANEEVQSDVLTGLLFGENPSQLIPMVLDNRNDLKEPFLSKALAMEKELVYNMEACEAAQKKIANFSRMMDQKISSKMEASLMKLTICPNSVIHRTPEEIDAGELDFQGKVENDVEE